MKGQYKMSNKNTERVDERGYHINELEILKFKNIQLQKQLARKEIESLNLQEALVAKMISERVGEDVTTWQFDLERGMVFSPKPPSASIPKVEVNKSR